VSLQAGGKPFLFAADRIDIALLREPVPEEILEKQPWL
jgi:hypothetical protein